MSWFNCRMLKTKRSLQKQADRKDNLLTKGKTITLRADFSSLKWKPENNGMIYSKY